MSLSLSPRIVVDSELVLQAIQPDDAETLFALVEKNRLHLRKWLPWLDFNTEVAHSENFIREARAEASAQKGLVTTIRYRGQHCGIIGFNSILSLHRICEIGYWLDADHQGLGIMTRATRAMVDYAFTDLDMNKVGISAAEKNMQSRAIPERLGFVIEGTARDAEWLYDHYVDLVRYAMLRADWPGTETV